MMFLVLFRFDTGLLLETRVKLEPRVPHPKLQRVDPRPLRQPHPTLSNGHDRFRRGQPHGKPAGLRCAGAGYEAAPGGGSA